VSGGSVNRRLIVAAGVWIAVALLVTGLLLGELFRRHLSETFDADLHTHQMEMLALIEPDAEGAPRLRHHPADPRFTKPLSGWYWEIRSGATRIAGSRSLWDTELPPPAAVTGEAYPLTGPRGRGLRAISREFRVADVAAPLVVTLAGPRAEIGDPLAAFARTLVVALAVLGLGLGLAVAVQVRFGLRPLQRVRAALGDVREGRAERLEGPFPAEIGGLVEELNGLIEHNDRLLAHARDRAGDLAHALKTPLAALRNDAAAIAEPRGCEIKRHAELIGGAIDRELSRARLTGPALGQRADVGEVAEGLRRVLIRSEIDKDLSIELDLAPGLTFAGDRADLNEMLGNLMQNACRWAARRVRVTGRLAGSAGPGLDLTVEDDGPGIPAAARSEVLARGHRLDESTPGSGLGLAIVEDTVAAYGGRLELADSGLGGLAARLLLPARRPSERE